MRASNDDDHPEGERRTLTRARTVLKGKLAALDASFTYDCVVRDLSTAGAQVRVLGEEALPSPLILILIRDGLAHECAVAWAAGQRLGLRFLKTHDLQSPAGRELGLIHHLWSALTLRVCTELG